VQDGSCIHPNLCCRGFEHDYLEYYDKVQGFVDDLYARCPTMIVKWGLRNEILNIWP
jgi:hypothetical protein